MRSGKRLRRAAALIFVIAWSASPAAAQVYDAIDMTGMSIYAEEEAVMDAARETVTRRPSRAQPAPAPAPTERLTYVPSVERRRANFARFVDRMRVQDPTGAAALEKELASADVIDRIGKELTAFGMRTDNVGDAYAIWWLNAWLASRQRSDTPPARQIAAVRAQAARAMAAVPEIAGGSDAVKQEVAESNLILAMLIGAFMERAKNDPALFRQVAESVAKGARASGLDLATMELTDDGFQASDGAKSEAGEPDAPKLAGAQQEDGDYGIIAPIVGAGAAGLIGGLLLSRGRRSHRADRG
ncbi:DUF6683 family protein [Allosphingosinicella deserti]|nr:DUF6683 family protein [Sphingomonas deserti]